MFKNPGEMSTRMPKNRQAWAKTCPQIQLAGRMTVGALPLKKKRSAGGFVLWRKPLPVGGSCVWFVCRFIYPLKKFPWRGDSSCGPANSGKSRNHVVCVVLVRWDAENNTICIHFGNWDAENHTICMVLGHCDAEIHAICKGLGHYDAENHTMCIVFGHCDAENHTICMVFKIFLADVSCKSLALLMHPVRAASRKHRRAQSLARVWFTPVGAETREM